MKHSVSSGGVVLNNKGQVLVVSQHGKAWALPKGHIEKDEELEQTAKREIAEESGVIDLALVKYLGHYTRTKFNDSSEHKTIHLYLFTTNQIDLAPEDPKNPEARWIKIDDVANILTIPEDKANFIRIKNQLFN